MPTNNIIISDVVKRLTNKIATKSIISFNVIHLITIIAHSIAKFNRNHSFSTEFNFDD